MPSETRPAPTDHAAEEAAIRKIHEHMIEAWNRGSGAEFATHFSPTADFIAFEGTHLTGRDEIAAFHQPLFDTILRGTRLEGEVKFVRLLSPSVAVHGVVRTALAGQEHTLNSRNSMQLFVATKGAEAWVVEAMLNARQLTLPQQAFADELASLAPPAQQQVAAFVFSLKAQPKETA
jgi:uncharacterized protein (TIGR02246 family)